MSQSAPAGQAPSQIIIVRRGHEGEEAHHGGVWKIAFADFMTAMMAFFLVMWLTNASDDATKKQIAQYFNPIKLNSSTPATMGLEPSEEAPTKAQANAAAGDVKNGGDPDTKPLSGIATGGAEQALFRDPYAVLAEIAAEGGPGVQAGVPGVPDGSGLPGLNGGEAYRDPFDPTSWQLQPNMEESDPAAARQPSEFQIAGAAQAPAPETTTVVEPAVEPEPASEPAKPEPEPKPETAEAAKTKAEMARAEAERLEQAIKAAAPASAGGVEVTASEGGVTISLADSLTEGMFEIGSAKPTPAAVRLVETIAKLLTERSGSIVIRGHTDARPYAGIEYDNWRLSTARAHMAYYMLARGGFDETRVESIEGFGDRKLKDPADPNSAANRRIEIFLREPAA